MSFLIIYLLDGRGIKMRITRDKKFYKLLLGISLPIAMQNLINFAVSMIDTLMVGSLGEVPLASVSIANNLFFILTILMFGLASGSNIMISQYWGKEDVKTIHRILAIMYRVCVGIVLIFVGIAAVLPTQFMKIFTTDAEVIAGGVSYLRIVCIGYLFYAIANCTIMMLRSVKTVKVSIVVYTISLCVNGFLNWVFIFGNLGAPAMGVQGAAIATAIARITEFAIIMIFMIFIEDKIKLRLKYLIKVERIILKDYVSTCSPVLFNELLWSTGSSMISVVVGWMGTEIIAANTINSVAFQLATVFIFGISNATAVIIGNTIGEGEKEKAKEYAFSSAIFSLLVGIIAGVIIYILRPFVVDLYNVSDATKAVAMEIMSVTSIILVFQSVGVSMMMGVLRGGGDAKFVLLNDLIFMWFMAIPGGFFAVLVLDLPIIPVFFILKSDEIIKSFVAIFRVISGKWVRDVTRDFSQIELEA